MNRAALQMMLNAGNDHFVALEQETLSCLKNLEAMTETDIEQFIDRRQEIITAIQRFDTELSRGFGSPEQSGAAADLESFRRQQASLLRRVMDTDGLLLALAVREMALLKARLDQLSLGRRALHGYREETGGCAPSRQRIA